MHLPSGIARYAARRFFWRVHPPPVRLLCSDIFNDNSFSNFTAFKLSIA